ncbi:hypothetical protein [Vibrio algarum]|uniref:YnhF family membrane protein n=1 Tax=Vibrio algarum TaxID=3020714 RepID=A0ABT4YVP5_9VIBR|nr:hypothetical protein [Vibrio sp. KJ40-1]MDB1125530.1 hypothetical protein [Vibrio sp. KJ40-1]
MSSILTSQIETPKVNEKTTSVLREIATIATMFSVTATIVLLTSLTWIA